MTGENHPYAVELYRLGFNELATVEHINSFFSNDDMYKIVAINSSCGCVGNAFRRVVTEALNQIGCECKMNFLLGAGFTNCANEAEAVTYLLESYFKISKFDSARINEMAPSISLFSPDNSPIISISRTDFARKDLNLVLREVRELFNRASSSNKLVENSCCCE